MSRFRSLASSLVSLVVVAASVALPANAEPAPSITLSNTANSLAGSLVENFDPAVTLRVDLTVDRGSLKVVLGDSGALTAPGRALNGSTVGITGTQAQINAALATTTLSQDCTAARSVQATVVEGVDFLVFNPENGHFYAMPTTSGITWDQARSAALAMTIPNTTGHGYLANITSAAENTFLNNVFPNTPMVGGSDAAADGEWFWMDGPEAGTKFFSAGAAVNNAFVKWNANEPNGGNSETALQLWQGDTWNDISRDNSYVVEFGGMPGDDFTGVRRATTTKAITVDPLLAGTGTESSPYLIEDQQDFEVLTVCSGVDKYFKQTANIATNSSFAGQSSFSGHYDGNGKTLDIRESPSMSQSIFGDVSGTSEAVRSSIKNLDVIAGARPGLSCGNAVVASALNFAEFDDVNLTGAAIKADCDGGLLALTVRNSIVKNSSVAGQIKIIFHSMMTGGLASYAENSQFTNVQCNLDVGFEQNEPFIDARLVGGCVGVSNSSSYTRVSSTGTIDFADDNLMMVRLMGVGGLVGESYEDMILESSSAVTITTKDADQVGGLIGMANNTTINRSFSTGSVSVTEGSGTGGLVGYSTNTAISNSYSTGSVNGAYMVGGLVGNMQSNSSISKSYATGLVTSANADMTRGLVGYSSNSNIFDSFWKILPGGVASTVEPFGQEVPKLAGELKKISTFVGWNISATPSSSHDWAICQNANGGYPYLAWQSVANGCPRTFLEGSKVSVTGLAYVGSTLSAVPANFDPLATLTYQWYAGEAQISGATSAYYQPVADLKGKKISVVVLASKDGYISQSVSSGQTVLAGAPKATTAVVGGFAAKASKATTASKAAVSKALSGIGFVLSVKCEGFASGKKLTSTQRALATARANTVCSAIKAAHKTATTKSSATIAKKTDKILEGVRVTITSVKP